jgi:hypothetical protein
VSRDELLDDIMVYWLNGAGASSARLYWESFGGAAGNAAPVNVPMGASIFPKEIFRTSQRFASAVYQNIVFWRDKDSGGHFACIRTTQGVRARGSGLLSPNAATRIRLRRGDIRRRLARRLQWLPDAFPGGCRDSRSPPNAR